MLTVGIVALLQPEYTRYCIEQAARSTLAQNNQLSLIVVLNGATIEVANTIKEMEEEFSFQVIVNSENIGYAAACNQILEQCYTDYVCFLHNDCLVTSRTFELLVKTAEQLPDKVAAIIPQTNYANEYFPCIEQLRERFSKVKPPNKERITRERLEFSLKEMYGDLEDFAVTAEIENAKDPVFLVEEISSFCCLFRRKTFLGLKGFNSQFDLRGYEDKEFLLRLHQKDYQLAVCKTAFVHHHGNLTTDGEGFSYPEVMKEQERLYQECLEKHKRIKTESRSPGVQPLLYLSSAYRRTVKSINKEKEKRLLFFGSHYPPENAGGAELSAHETHLLLKSFGIDVCAFTIRNRKHQKFEILNSFDHEGVRVLQVPERTGEALQQKLRLIIDEYQPQVVLMHTIFAYYALKLLSKEYPEIKRIFSFRHQTDITDGRLQAFLKNDGGTEVLSNSEWMKKVLFEKCQRDSEVIKPVVIPDSCRVKDRLTRSSVTIGNGVLSKGIKEFLEVARLLPEIPFDVWGTFDSSIPSEMVPPNVTKRGWSTNLTDLYNDARIVINLSEDPEPFGRTLIEAMYNGIPIIAHNEGGPKEIVKEGGVLVDSTKEVIETIVRIYTDESFYEKLCEGTKRDLERYNPFYENEKLIRAILRAFDNSVYPEYTF